MILSTQAEKDFINKIIASALDEILKKGFLVDNKSIGDLEDDINLMLRALQLKNKIYDYACSVNYNSLLGFFEGKIIYNLIKSDDVEYESVIEFQF